MIGYQLTLVGIPDLAGDLKIRDYTGNKANMRDYLLPSYSLGFN